MHEDKAIREQGWELLSITATTSGSENALSFRTEYLVSLDGAETQKTSCRRSTVQQTRKAQSRLTGAEQSCLARDGPGIWAAWPQGCLTAMLFSQTCCIKIELFCAEKMCLFAPQIGDSSWH